jgi:hypothetical protein
MMPGLPGKVSPIWGALMTACLRSGATAITDFRPAKDRPAKRWERFLGLLPRAGNDSGDLE